MEAGPSSKNTIDIAASVLTKSHHTQGNPKPWIPHSVSSSPDAVTVLGHLYQKQRCLVLYVVAILPLSGLQGNRLTEN